MAHRIQTISLRKRLRDTPTNQPDFLAAFELFLFDYFEGLAKVSKDTYFLEVYERDVRMYDRQFRQGYIARLVELPQITEDLALPEEERIELLYKVLVEPFATLKQYQ